MFFRELAGILTQLELTNQLSDTVLGELAVTARGQLVLFVGDFKVEPTDLEAAWAGAAGVAPANAGNKPPRGELREIHCSNDDQSSYFCCKF